MYGHHFFFSAELLFFIFLFLENKQLKLKISIFFLWEANKSFYSFVYNERLGKYSPKMYKTFTVNNEIVVSVVNTIFSSKKLIYQVREVRFVEFYQKMIEIYQRKEFRKSCRNIKKGTLKLTKKIYTVYTYTYGFPSLSDINKGGSLVYFFSEFYTTSLSIHV